MALRTTRQRLGAVIRERRDALGLTQEDAAERAGVSTRYLRSLEAGGPAAAMEVVERVVGALGWSLHDLVDVLIPGDGDGPPAHIHRMLDEAWTRATTREREIVQSTLRLLASTGKVSQRR